MGELPSQTGERSKRRACFTLRMKLPTRPLSSPETTIIGLSMSARTTPKLEAAEAPMKLRRFMLAPCVDGCAAARKSPFDRPRGEPLHHVALEDHGEKNGGERRQEAGGGDDGVVDVGLSHHAR